MLKYSFSTGLFLFHFLETVFTSIPLKRTGTPVLKNVLGGPIYPTPDTQPIKTPQPSTSVAYCDYSESNPIPLCNAKLVQPNPLEYLWEDEELCLEDSPISSNSLHVS